MLAYLLAPPHRPKVVQPQAQAKKIFLPQPHTTRRGKGMTSSPPPDSQRRKSAAVRIQLRTTSSVTVRLHVGMAIWIAFSVTSVQTGTPQQHSEEEASRDALCGPSAFIFLSCSLLVIWLTGIVIILLAA